MGDVQFAKGLEGVIAAESKICKIDGEKGKLSYMGYSIEDLIELGRVGLVHGSAREHHLLHGGGGEVERTTGHQLLGLPDVRHDELERLYAYARDGLGGTYLPEAVLAESLTGSWRTARRYGHTVP